MADYFTHFYCLLDVKTPENAARAIELYHELQEAHRYITDEDLAEEPEPLGFRLSVQSGLEGTRLWIHDDVTGDPEDVIRFVRRCAKLFGLSGLWGFQYANTCSKLRINSFRGGAHVLDLSTGDTVGWTDTDGWFSRVLDGGDPDV